MIAGTVPGMVMVKRRVPCRCWPRDLSLIKVARSVMGIGRAGPAQLKKPLDMSSRGGGDYSDAERFAEHFRSPPPRRRFECRDKA